jgi:hypothetical protein
MPMDFCKTKKYGRLTFIRDEYVKNEHTYSRWKCECGREIVTRKNNVLFGTKISCGCSRHLSNSKLWRGVGEISKTFWSRIRGNARSRNRTLSITMKDAWKLFLKQNRKCALSDEPLIFAKAGTNFLGGTASLDRIDSSKGYTIDNVQWVHRDINRMKSDLLPATFFMWCKKIVDKHSKME